MSNPHNAIIRESYKKLQDRTRDLALAYMTTSLNGSLTRRRVQVTYIEHYLEAVNQAKKELKRAVDTKCRFLKKPDINKLRDTVMLASRNIDGTAGLCAKLLSEFGFSDSNSDADIASELIGHVAALAIETEAQLERLLIVFDECGLVDSEHYYDIMLAEEKKRDELEIEEREYRKVFETERDLDSE